LKIAEGIIKEAIRELKNDYPESTYIDKFNRIESAPKDKTFNKHKPRYKYFGLSFVEDKDSLTHWERYTNNSGGVCIGLNVALIENLFDVYAIPDIISDWLQTTPIVYSNEDQIKYAKSSILAKIDGMKGLSELEFAYSAIYYTTLAALKPRFKHKGFDSEKEQRIYLKEGEAEATAKLMKDMMRSSDPNNGVLFKNISDHIIELATKLNILKCDKRHGVFKDAIRSYYALNLEEIWRDTLIPEIVLGPKCYQNKKELESFINACELYRTKVSVSKIPIR
jgi:hypothetical protein